MRLLWLTDLHLDQAALAARDVVVRPNLRVQVGEARYGLPRVQAVWDYRDAGGSP